MNAANQVGLSALINLLTKGERAPTCQISPGPASTWFGSAQHTRSEAGRSSLLPLVLALPPPRAASCILKSRHCTPAQIMAQSWSATVLINYYCVVTGMGKFTLQQADFGPPSISTRSDSTAH